MFVSKGSVNEIHLIIHSQSNTTSNINKQTILFTPNLDKHIKAHARFS